MICSWTGSKCDSIDARRDVAEMAQRGREMVDLDVGVGTRSGLDAVPKVGVMGGEVRAAAGGFFDQLVARAVEFVAPDLAEDHHPVGAVVGVAVLEAFLHVGRPDALLKDQLLGTSRFGGSGVLEGDVLRVGPLLVVIEVALRAESGDEFRAVVQRFPRQHFQPGGGFGKAQAENQKVATLLIVAPDTFDVSGEKLPIKLLAFLFQFIETVSGILRSGVEAVYAEFDQYIRLE